MLVAVILLFGYILVAIIKEIEVIETQDPITTPHLCSILLINIILIAAL